MNASENLVVVELDAAKGDSSALSVYEAKVAVREAQATVKRDREELAEEKRTHSADIEDAKTHRITVLANEIGKELNVNPQSLLTLTDGTEAKMRKAAEVLPKVTPSGDPPKTPDSGLGSGAGKSLSEMTTEDQDKMSDDEWFKKREEELKSK